METTMIRIALVLMILCGGVVLVKWCVEIFRGIMQEMTDDGRPKIADGTKEWEELKKTVRIGDGRLTIEKSTINNRK